MAREVVDIANKLSAFSQHWSPKVVAQLNDYEIKVVKLQGEFVWHANEETDELPGRPWGTDHPATGRRRGATARSTVRRAAGCRTLPDRRGEVHALLIEPTGVVNTGNAGGVLTARYDDSLL